MNEKIKPFLAKIRLWLKTRLAPARSDCGRCGVCKHACALLGDSKRVTATREE